MRHAGLGVWQVGGYVPADRQNDLHRSWLQLQLSYSEGCHDRLRWLSDATLSTQQQQQQQMADGAACSNGRHDQLSFREATRSLLAALLTLPLPGAAALQGGSPDGTDDMLRWCSQQADAQPPGSSALLDSLVGCLDGLLSIAGQAGEAGMIEAAAALVDVLRQVPVASLHGLLRRLFIQMLCLLAGVETAAATGQGVGSSGGGSGGGEGRPSAAAGGAAAALACGYGRVLLGVMGAVRGASEALFDSCTAEVRHLLPTPQVRAAALKLVLGW